MDTPFRISEKTATELAKQFGTPLYVIGEEPFRLKIRGYREAFNRAYANSQLSYASKANSTLAVLRIAYEEGCLIDVASEGELRAALLAGVPADRCEMHGNNKTEEEIRFALESVVRTIVVDNFEEIELLARLSKPAITEVQLPAANRQKTQDTAQSTANPTSHITAGPPQTHFMLRLAPGVDPITHEKISTGQEDSKFGFNISDGSAERALLAMLDQGLPMVGFHCHVGSQLLDPSAQIAGGEALALFAAEMREKHGFAAKVINMGGGVGIRYTEKDVPMPIHSYCEALVHTVSPILQRAGLSPTLMQEPGRSLIGESGLTLYRVGAVKSVPAPTGRKTYVIVDGGLSDNPRPVMYDASYTVLSLGKSNAPMIYCTVSGKHCETDKLFPSVLLPQTIERGDLLQVLCTGAYNSSMANNYNRYLRPATVLIRETGEHDLVQRRETWEELFAREIVPTQ